MREKILNAAGFLYKLFFLFCVFVSPLVFFTDLTRNPFNAQSFVLLVSAAALLVLWAARVLAKREITLKYNAADILFVYFVAAALASLAVNIFYYGPAPALLGEFLRRGHVLFTNAFAAWFIAKAFAVYGAEGKNGGNPWPLLLWGFAWVLYPALKMRGLFDIYAAAVWAFGLWLAFKALKDGGVKEVAGVFINVAALAAAYGIMQNLGFDLFWKVDISGEFGARAVSTFGNPNFLSSYILLALPLVFVGLLEAKKKNSVFYCFLILLLYAAYLAISATRSSWLGALAGFAVLFLFKDLRALIFAGKKRCASAVLCCALVFILWPAGPRRGDYSPSAVSRVKEAGALLGPGRLTFNVPEGAINQAWHQRLMMWTCSVDMLKKSPVLGRGWGGFQLGYAPCQGRLLAKYPQLGFLRTQANSAHNDFMEVAAQSGLSGFCLYLAFLAAVAVLFLKNFKNMQPGARVFYCALFAGAAAFMADNMLNITAHTSITAFAFWFVLSSLNMPACKTGIKKTGAVAGIFLFSACAMLAAPLVFWQCAKFKADISDLKAYKAFASGNFAAAALHGQKAVGPAGRSAESYYIIVNSYVKTGNTAEAFAFAKEGAKYNPHYHEFHFRASAAALNLGLEAEAFEGLKTTLLLYPSYYPAANLYAQLLAAKPGAYAEAENIKLLETAAALLAFDNGINLNLARVYGAKSDWKAARALASKILARDNFDPDVLDFLQTLGGKEDPIVKKALEARKLKEDLQAPVLPAMLGERISAFCDSHPGDLSAVMLRGELYFKQDRPQEQVQEVLLAVYESNKDDLALNFALASSYAAAGADAEAARYLRHILSLNPFNAGAQQRLTRLDARRR